MLLPLDVEPGMMATITNPNNLTGYVWAEENANDITEHHFWPSGWSNINAVNETVVYTWDSDPGFKNLQEFQTWVDNNCTTTGGWYAVCVIKSMDWDDLGSKSAPTPNLSESASGGVRQIDPQWLIGTEDPDKRDGSGWAETITGGTREHFFAPSGWSGVAASGETTTYKGLSDKSSWDFNDFKDYVDDEYSSAVLANGSYIWADVTVTSW